jgi:hypothetical protein
MRGVVRREGSGTSAPDRSRGTTHAAVQGSCGAFAHTVPASTSVHDRSWRENDHAAIRSRIAQLPLPVVVNVNVMVPAASSAAVGV